MLCSPIVEACPFAQFLLLGLAWRNPLDVFRCVRTFHGTMGLMWPGTLSITSKKLPAGGTAMFALLAMAGDLGGSTGQV